MFRLWKSLQEWQKFLKNTRRKTNHTHLRCTHAHTRTHTSSRKVWQFVCCHCGNLLYKCSFYIDFCRLLHILSYFSNIPIQIESFLLLQILHNFVRFVCYFDIGREFFLYFGLDRYLSSGLTDKHLKIKEKKDRPFVHWNYFFLFVGLN